MIEITLNGEKRELESGQTVGAFLTAFGFDAEKVALERNLEIVPRSQFEATIIEAGDQLELVHFIGGGNEAPLADAVATGMGKVIPLHNAVFSGKRLGVAISADHRPLVHRLVATEALAVKCVHRRGAVLPLILNLRGLDVHVAQNQCLLVVLLLVTVATRFRFDGALPRAYEGMTLATVAVPLEEIGSEAVQLLTWRLQHADAPRRTVHLDPRWVDGDTIGPAPAQ